MLLKLSLAMMAKAIKQPPTAPPHKLSVDLWQIEALAGSLALNTERRA
jgi:hypothetical protein